jgi:hypothetical protein
VSRSACGSAGTMEGCVRRGMGLVRKLGLVNPMTTDLGADLEAFVLEHEYCGELAAPLRTIVSG